jgi:hypothetical protein
MQAQCDEASGAESVRAVLSVHKIRDLEKYLPSIHRQNTRLTVNTLRLDS